MIAPAELYTAPVTEDEAEAEVRLEELEVLVGLAREVA